MWQEQTYDWELSGIIVVKIRSCYKTALRAPRSNKKGQTIKSDRDTDNEGQNYYR